MELPPVPSDGARLCILGDLRIIDSRGRAVAPLEAQPKRAALLIYLAVQPAGHFCSRDHLVALFWPDFDDERARNSLRTSLYYVRRAMGPEVVRSRPDGALEVDPQALWCDVRAFEAAMQAKRWTEAADLYRGDFLAAGGQSVSVEFDQWVEATRRRLRRQCAEAHFGVAEGLEQAGDLDGALVALTRARGLLPADEAILRRVLLLWGRTGNRVRAVQEYEAFAQTLEELYELEPSPETREILDRVTAGTLPKGGAMPPARGEGVAESGRDGPPPAEGVTVEAPARAAPRRSRRLGPVAVVAALVMAAFALGWAWGEGPAPLGGDAVAVLPFPVSGSGDLAALAAALPALVSDELRATGAEVLEPRSLEDVGPRWDDAVSRARELGAALVVTGQVIAMGDTLAILVATVPTSGAPVPREWARATGRPSDIGAMTVTLVRALRDHGR